VFVIVQISQKYFVYSAKNSRQVQFVISKNAEKWGDMGWSADVSATESGAVQARTV